MRDWKDLGGGQFKLTITVDGDPTAPPSVFRGTREEILDKLADSQESANRRLHDLRRNGGNGAPQPAAPASSAPRPLSPAERLETVSDLQNPATVDKAVTRILESVVGPVAELQKDRAANREANTVRTAVQAAESFFERTPEWYPSEHNKKALTNYMKGQGLDPTDTQNYTKAFDELSAAELLQARPAEDDTPTQPDADEGRNAPAANAQHRAPTRYSTSVRSSDISGRPPVPGGKPHLKYTREQLENLSASDYKQLMISDRVEMERCEAYYAKNPKRAR